MGAVKMVADLSIRILIVDNYRTMLRIIHDLLYQMGFRNIDEALNADQALQKLRENVYGLVLSDWNAGPIDGIDLLKEVRADKDLKHLPFIMVTSEATIDNVVKAKKAGVDNYIIKPFDAGTFKLKISAVLGSF